MIVYGRRATLVKSEILFEPCTNCGTSSSVQMNVYQRYAHIFWIPFFPIGKTGASVCSNCKQVLKLKQMPPSLRLSYDNVKRNTKIPVWNFSGLFLVALIVIAVAISQKQKSEKVSKLVLAPRAGDVFEIKVKDSVYTLYKVQKIVGDTVYFFANKYQTDQETGLSDLANKEFITNETYGMSKSELIGMNQREEILDIDRK